MYIQKIKNSFTGYVKIRAEGYYIEKLINLCRANGIAIEDLKREKSTIMECNVPVNRFRDVCKMAKKNRCRIKILKKRGIPFLLNRYRKRKSFAIALVVLIVFIIALSKFVWNIEITGNNNIKSDEILSIVYEEGVKVGNLKRKIDTKAVAEKIRIERPDISWVGIKVVGTNVIIEIVEADKAPNVIKKDEYCNIVASKDGMISSASAQNGTLQVKEGDVVKKGDILIGGWMEGKYTGTRYVHANGDIKAKVWYSKKEKVYFKKKTEKETGNMEKKYSLNINKFKINFYKKLSKFEIYDTISEEKKLKLSSDFYLPISLIINENHEKIVEEKNLSKDEATQIGVEELSSELDKQIEQKEDILNTYINTNESEEYIEVEVIYEVLENIGTEEKIAL